MHKQVSKDERVSRCTQRSNEELFEHLMREHSAALFHFISRFVGNYDDASDICQHVFLQLYLSLPRLHTDRPLTTWLFQVARNCCTDQMRRKRAICFSELEAPGWQRVGEEEGSPLSLLPDRCPSPAEETEQRDLQRRLGEAISALPAKLRAIVSLRYTAELSYAEIGARLHISPGTAKTYFQRAKPLLRTQLIGQGMTSGEPERLPPLHPRGDQGAA